MSPMGNAAPGFARRWHPRWVACGALALAVPAVGCGSQDPAPSGGTQSQPLADGGTITDFTGLCLDVQGGSAASGTPIQLWDCNGNGWQTWTYQSGSFVGWAGKCLDVRWAGTANGTPVQLWDCNGTPAQQWSLRNGQLVGIGGKCLDVNDFHSVQGQTLQMWDCNGGANQQFHYAGSSPGDGAGDGGAGEPGASDSGGTEAGTETDLQKAQRFVSGLGMGVDIERARITYMTYQGHVIGQSPDYFAYLKANGVDHIRVFYPWSPSFLNGGVGVGPGQVPPTSGTFEAMLQGALNATRAGVKVFFDLMDLTNSSDCQGSSLDVVHAWLKAAAQKIAGYGFDPSMIAFGPINEPTGDSNAVWDPILQDLHDLLRQYLPASQGWILTKGGAYWADPATFASGGRIFSDKLVVYMVHYYPEATPPHDGDGAVENEWAGVAQKVEAYAAANGAVPVVLGESGLWNGNDLPYGGPPDPGSAAWPSVIQDTAKGAGILRPLPWAITDGSDPVSSGGSDATLPPTVAAAFQSATSFIRSQSYYAP